MRRWLSLFSVGDRVQVVSGPFVSFDGVVEGIDWQQMKLQIAILIFGQETVVNLSPDQVEKS